MRDFRRLFEPASEARRNVNSTERSSDATTALERSVEHDYSTSSTGIVPLTERRSRYHFLSLWITLAAGFTYLFLGFQYHDAGYSLVKAVAAGAVGAIAYLLYALPAAYLGSVTGQ